jgi:hypothetical protein
MDSSRAARRSTGVPLLLMKQISLMKLLQYKTNFTSPAMPSSSQTRRYVMTAQLRFFSRMVCLLAFGLMALMSGPKAHAQASITNLSATGHPGGYDNVSDTVNFNLTFSYVSTNGGYNYSINAYAMYYSGPNATGTLLQTTSTQLYSTSGPLYPGTDNIWANVNLNTPAIFRAMEPAGTQSFRYVYVVQANGGWRDWSGSVTNGGPTCVVHG